MSSVSALDVATDSEFVDRRISDEILTPPPLTDHPPPPSNDAEPPMVVPKAKCTAPPLLPVGESADIVAHLRGPNNDSPPTLVIAPS